MIPLLITLLVFAFLLFSPLTVKATWRGEPVVRVGIFVAFFKVFPRKKKKSKKKAEKKSKPAHKIDSKGQEKKEKKKKKLDLKLIYGLVLKLLRHRPRVIKIRKAKLVVQLGNEDPGDLALTYGGLCALLENVMALLGPQNLSRWDVRIIPDFSRTKTEAEGVISVSTNLMRILSTLISLAFYVIMSDSKVKGDLKHG